MNLREQIEDKELRYRNEDDYSKRVRESERHEELTSILIDIRTAVESIDTRVPEPGQLYSYLADCMEFVVKALVPAYRRATPKPDSNDAVTALRKPILDALFTETEKGFDGVTHDKLREMLEPSCSQTFWAALEQLVTEKLVKYIPGKAATEGVYQILPDYARCVPSLYERILDALYEAYAAGKASLTESALCEKVQEPNAMLVYSAAQELALNKKVDVTSKTEQSEATFRLARYRRFPTQE